MEKKYIYLLLVKGADGRFSTTAYEDFEKASQMLELFVEAQKEIEGLGNNVDVDWHKHESLRLPEFIIRDEDILKHVTVNYVAHFAGKDRVVQTDRYIIRVEIG